MNNKTPTYPVGVINPVEIRTITRTLSIDTLFRDNYFNSARPSIHFMDQVDMIYDIIFILYDI